MDIKFFLILMVGIVIGFLLRPRRIEYLPSITTNAIDGVKNLKYGQIIKNIHNHHHYKVMTPDPEAFTCIALQCITPIHVEKDVLKKNFIERIDLEV